MTSSMPTQFLESSCAYVLLYPFKTIYNNYNYNNNNNIINNNNNINNNSKLNY